MEWNQLHYFQAVAQLEHFTRAAEAISVSQPALSRAIARLEEELNVPLFDREGRNVTLNRYGQIFLNRVNRALQEIAEGQQEIKRLISPVHGTVSLGFIHSQGSDLVPNLLGLFRKDFPEIQIKLYQNTSNRVLEQLINAETDICICTQPISQEKMQWLHLSTEELYLTVPKDHPLSEKNTITLHELAEEPFIIMKKETVLGEIADGLFKDAGFIPKVAFEGDDLHTISGLVAAELGVALLPRFKGLDTLAIAQLHVSEPICQRMIGLAWVKDRYLSPAAECLKTFVQEHFLK